MTYWFFLITIVAPVQLGELGRLTSVTLLVPLVDDIVRNPPQASVAFGHRTIRYGVPLTVTIMAVDCPSVIASLSHKFIPIDFHPDASASPVMIGLLPVPYAPKNSAPDDDPDLLKE